MLDFDMQRIVKKEKWESTLLNENCEEKYFSNEKN